MKKEDVVAAPPKPIKTISMPEIAKVLITEPGLNKLIVPQVIPNSCDPSSFFTMISSSKTIF